MIEFFTLLGQLFSSDEARLTIKFILMGVTILLLWFGAYMTGQGIARTWRPMWQIVPYSILLGLSSRFLIWGLFHDILTKKMQADVVSFLPFAIDSIVLLGIAFLAFRMTRASSMVAQYPWLYKRTSPISWTELPQEPK